VTSLLRADASGEDDFRQQEFKRFVNEFGTHYASTTEMGTKISIERRYTQTERSNASLDEMKSCNTLSGVKVLGFQTEMNHLNCSNDELKKNKIDSKNVDRMIISTYGSFIADSLKEWSKQV
jgi:hypothetical protein